MNNAEYLEELSYLLSDLSTEELHQCIAGVPGPLLELRSGTLPILASRKRRFKDFDRAVAGIRDIDSELLGQARLDIAQEYSFPKVYRGFWRMAANAASRAMLLADFISAIAQKVQGVANYQNLAEVERVVRIRVCDRTIQLTYPVSCVSMGLLWEIFGEQAYQMSGQEVSRIYDFGANIGLSATYFHAAFPRAELVCIEPMEENLALLEKNLQDNGIDAKIVRAAAGSCRGTSKLFFGDQSYALPSLDTKQSQAREVDTIPFDEIVTGRDYGLKIDIEGSEQFLAEFPDVISNAAWIVGELHRSGNRSRNAGVDRFFDLVKQSFRVEVSRPVLYFVGDEIELCTGIRAWRG